MRNVSDRALAEHSPPVLFGRRPEREAIEATLREARSSGLRAVLITGQAGIGKSRLLEAAARTASELGLRVLKTAGGEAESGIPYATLSDLMRDALAGLDSELGAAQRTTIDAILDPRVGDLPLKPLAVALAVRQILRELSNSAPLAVLLDDLHWTDDASGRPLAFALHRLHDARIAVVASQRPRVRPAIDLPSIIAPERLAYLPLGPLDPDSIAELLAVRLGRRPPLPTLHRILELSAGNPFVALELGRAAEAEPTLLAGGEVRRLPDRLSRLIGSRLSRLPPRARHTLARVAAITRPDDALLEDLGIDRDHLQAAVEAELLHEEDGRWEFSHPLIRTVAAGRLPMRERRRLHARLAQLTRDPVERARHVARSALAPDEEAAGVVEAGAEMAWFRGAPLEGAILADQAVALSPPEGRQQLFRRLLLAGRLRHEAGDNVTAHRLLELALATAPRASRALALMQLARVELQTIGEDGNRRYQEALRATRDDALRAEIHIELTVGRQNAAGLAAARRHARMATRYARRTNDELLAARSLVIAARMDFDLTGRVDEPALKRILTAAARLDGDSADAVAYQGAALHASHMLMWSGQFPRARDVLCRISDHPPRESRLADDAEWYLAWTDLWTGRWADAGARIDTLMANGEARGERSDQALALKATLETLRGTADAPRTVEQALVAARQVKSERFVEWMIQNLAAYALSAGDAARAAELLDPIVPTLYRLGFIVPHVACHTANAMEALAESGHTQLAHQLDADSTRRLRGRQSTMIRASLARARATTALAEGDTARARRLLEPWLESSELDQLPFLRARLRLVAGRLFRRERQRRRARGVLTLARNAFEQLGALLWLEQAKAEMARIGDRPTTSLGLTPTESRIADLAARGRTNREIAQALFLSARTVEWNLTRVYGKLGVRSRTELATRFR